MTTTLRSILRQCAERELEKGRCRVDDVVACAYANHEDVFASESERLVWQAARTITKAILSELTTDEDDAPRLPGILLPAAIAIRDDDSIYYVRSDQATWTELLAGKDERQANVDAANEALARYQRVLDRLRPLMENDPTLTVAGALLREEAA